MYHFFVVYEATVLYITSYICRLFKSSLSAPSYYIYILLLLSASGKAGFEIGHEKRRIYCDFGKCVISVFGSDVGKRSPANVSPPA